MLTLCLACENRPVLVFGPRAKGTKKRFADLGLALDIGRPLIRQKQLEFADEFDEYDLSYKADVVNLHTTSKHFAETIRPGFTELTLKAVA